MKSVMLVSALAAGAVLAGCGGPSGETREAQMESYAAAHGVDADVELDAAGEVKSVTVDGAFGGAKVGNDLGLPDGFPQDVPAYPKMEIYASSPIPGGFTVQARTSEPLDAVMAFYAEQLASAGWTPEAAGAASPQMSQASYRKGDRMASVTVTDVGDARMVQLGTMTMPQ